MARPTTTTPAEAAVKPPAPSGVTSVPEVKADQPVPINLAGFDPESQAAAINGGYTVTTGRDED